MLVAMLPIKLSDMPPTQSIIYVPLQVNRFQKSILLIVQYKDLKSRSGDFIVRYANVGAERYSTCREKGGEKRFEICFTFLLCGACSRNYGVATIRRLLKITGLFCKRAL